MKKTLTVLVTLLVTGILATHAQSKREIPPPPPLPRVVNPPPQKINMPETLQDFYKRNPAVAVVSWRNDSNGLMIMIQLKNGNTETYHLAKEEEVKIFNEKYGVPPNPPPPPPPKELN